MSIAPAPERLRPDVETDPSGDAQGDARAALPWVTLVWNDPVNLMTYVTYVFQSYFGYERRKAERLMMDVHLKGKAAVSHGSREEMERDAAALQGYGLWATFEKDE